MRLGVLDVGSNTVHLLLVDAHPGARPLPAVKEKTDLRLVTMLDKAGAVTPEGADQLIAACRRAVEVAEDKGAQSILAFATSALRDATNGDVVLDRIRAEAGVGLQVLGGEDESRLTFLAARRWYGWSSGRLLSLDIGGGSLEMAAGIDEDPDVSQSLPLGAARLTRDWFSADPPPSSEVKALRKYARAEIASVIGQVARIGPIDQAVASSKTFRSLARVTGAAPSADGPYVQRVLTSAACSSLVAELESMPAAERARLPGVSAPRAEQLLAGAIVADAALDLLEIETVDICPWALREGVILRQLDHLAGVGFDAGPVTG